MNFEVLYALHHIDQATNAYLVKEALNEYEITMKRYSEEILRDLSPTDATQIFIEKISLV